MSDDKEIYHVMVLKQKGLAQNDDKLAKNIQAGCARKEKFSSNWVKVNLNVVVDKFAHGIQPYVNQAGTKIIWSNPDKQIDLVCDVGGGSLRIQDMSVVGKQKRPRYLDLNGHLVKSIPKENGKQRGLTKAEQEALTHFLIMKREEMNNQ